MTQSIFCMPQDLMAGILSRPIIEEGSFHNRLVCKKWKQIIDEKVLKILVQNFKQDIGKIPRALGLRTIVTQFIERHTHPNASLSLSQFLRFDAHVKKAIGSHAVNHPEILVTREKLIRLMGENTNLHILWNEIEKRIYCKAPQLRGCSEISKQLAKSEQTILAQVHSLELHYSGLTAEPAFNSLFTPLDELPVTALPPEIKHFAHLKKLSLSENRIQVLPPEIKYLTRLVELDLTNTEISSLPKEIACLTNLQELYLDENGLGTIPKEIQYLLGLKKLSLECNEIQAVTAEIFKALTQLKKLNLDHNPLLFVDKEVIHSPLGKRCKRICAFQAAQTGAYLNSNAPYVILYRAIINRRELDVVDLKIKKAFIELATKEKKTIETFIKEGAVFEPPEMFFRSVHNGVFAQFDALEPHCQNKVHAIVCACSTRHFLDTDYLKQWGIDHMDVFLDAICTVSDGYTEIA